MERQSFSFCSITESFVLKQLKTLKTNKAIGLDRISARLLRDSAECIRQLSRPDFLTGHLRQALFHRFGNMVVTALFKGGDRTDCNNYRPITVIPTFSKILGRAVRQAVRVFISE